LTERTIRDVIADLLGPSRAQVCPRWPPDLFAVAATLVGRAGIYHRGVCFCAEGCALLDADARVRVVAGGLAWRQRIAKALRSEEAPLPRVPAGLAAHWKVLVASFGGPVGGDWDDALCRAVFSLLAYADEASVGIGFDAPGEDAVLRRGDMLLARNRLVSVTELVPLDRARVLPKQHTPQRGLTLRSYSHHLALCPAGDVDAVWHGRPVRAGRACETAQLLLLPWPIQVSRECFRSLPEESRRAAHPARFGYFSYEPVRREGSAPEFRTWLEERVTRALREVDRVDMLVFPELALGAEERVIAEEVADDHDAVLVAGLHGHDSAGRPRNRCLIDWTARTMEKGAQARRVAVEQTKHHRWCLDRGQIVQYGLGGRFDPRMDYWEYAELDRRRINFVTVDDWLTTTVLLCEDLARQDPVTHTIRAVGPNLIIALLMDGPQLGARWPARYASVLAEDPGSSVLTLTSVGMSRLSSPRAGDVDRRTIVARWRDVVRGEHELDIGTSDAAVLTLVKETREEFSADGRGDGGTSCFPTFGGFVTLGPP
jgi:hypothetical protein